MRMSPENYKVHAMESLPLIFDFFSSMSVLTPVRSALISVFHKDGLAPILHALHEQGVALYSTGGTQAFIESEGLPSTPIEDVTGFPSILDGRVKTLHPNVFGGILWRRSHPADAQTVAERNIPSFDMVIVDLYPFEDTVASGASEADIIEKIDIGGISLIRAGAKNFTDVWMVSSRRDYADVLRILTEQGAQTTLAQRKAFAARSFQVSHHYDGAIAAWFADGSKPFPGLPGERRALRYGENPHQPAWFIGNLDELFIQHNGKELSYNNLLDIDAAMLFCAEGGEDPTVAIIKHNNACGMASADTLSQAWDRALAVDPVSAFGGVIACNKTIEEDTATKMNDLFFEVVIAPWYSVGALDILKSKKNRIILESQPCDWPQHLVRSTLNGVLLQARDSHRDSEADLTVATKRAPSTQEVDDLLFASAVCKHTKSNTIVLAKDRQLIASGTGQTSRVDALKQAIQKAESFGISLEGAVMASDAFFPFPDCVEIAYEAGIRAVIQPGGSIKDQLSTDYCDANGMAMVMTGIRHFKH